MMLESFQALVLQSNLDFDYATLSPSCIHEMLMRGTLLFAHKTGTLPAIELLSRSLDRSYPYAHHGHCSHQVCHRGNTTRKFMKC